MSIVRYNLMDRPNYTPYCGAGAAEGCTHGMPRTRFNGKQFFCECGWESAFDEEFIQQYKNKWSIDK